jgi:serine/threonine protein kinase/tetratricopeptide (TPR) repeat protein
MSERWQRIKELFAAAVEISPSERETFLHDACGDDSRLRAHIELLLASHEQSSTFLETPAVQDVVATLPAQGLEGTRVGPYEIRALIGEGGMGAVYEAVRADDVFQKRVAIKVVKRGMDTNAVLRRFQYERQTLARLDHPNIAAVLDGGTTPDGLPYFVMDFVDGEPLDMFNARAGLGLTDQIQLFRTICGAVQYAHQNLVVHRDIKPDNILVTAAGVPKLVDFGIARVLSPDTSSFRTIDATGGPQRLLTYQYASPEQVRGDAVTTATDVYSLGVVLYELLAGQAPYNLRGLPLDEMERVVCEREPSRPSTMIADGAQKLRRRLAGDLDMIVLKAIRKEPERRYASVEQLSEDLRRYVDGLPVIARPDTFGYRTRKFIRRHRGRVAAASVVAIAVVVGLVTTAWQAQVARAERARAERRFNDVRQLANSVVFEMHDAIARLPGSTPARQLLVKRALEYQASLASEAAGDPALQRELAAAYRKIGDVQGNPYESNLGDPPAAMASYRTSLGILESVRQVDPGNGDVRREIAAAHERIGDIQAISGDVAGALESQRKALDIRLDLRGQSRRGDVRDLANSRKKVAEALLWSGDAAHGLENAREALRLRQEALAESSTTETQADLASAFTLVGEMLVASGDNQGALPQFQSSARIASEASRADRDNVRVRRQYAIALNKIGEALAALGDSTGAAEQHRRALAERQALADVDRSNTQARRDLAISHIMLASALPAAEARRESLDHLRESIRIFESLVAADGNASARADLAEANKMAGSILLRGGNVRDAINSFETAASLSEKVAAEDASDLDTRRGLAGTYQNLGDAHTMAARNLEATREARAAQWTAARASFQKAYALMASIRGAGALLPEDERTLESMSSKVLACTAELKSLNLSRR